MFRTVPIGITAPQRRARRPMRRGVASVLAMMFLVFFGSLGVAMAIVAQGNLRTADSARKVSRAMSAAESGLVLASKRLAKEGQRFVVRKGVIDSDFGHKLWVGTWSPSTDGEVEILAPTGYVESSPAQGLAEAVRNAHLADSNDMEVEAGDSGLPAIADDGTLVTRALRMFEGDDRVWFRLTYELVDGESAVRVTSVGADGDIRRTLQMDFRLNKRIEYAVLTPNRLMIGKNVMIEGPLATRYGTEPGELNPGNGDPLVMRSDFYYLAPELDALLDEFHAAVVAHDVDGDARLRPGHPSESAGTSLNPDFVDRDGDQYVTDFDLFLGTFDANADGMVVYDPLKAAAAGLGNVTSEFLDIDDQLARMVDLWIADRDGNGVVDSRDTMLGYNDGVLNHLDSYAKVTGRLAFGVTRADWEAAHGESYQTIVHGPVRARTDQAPASFGVSEEDMRVITTDMFSSSAVWFKQQADGGASFASQAASQASSGGTYTAPSLATYEPVPFGSPSAYDWYQRPIYEDMTFTNVKIPKGTNPLFRNCTFVGVVYVETDPDCIDVNWNYTGSIQQTILGGGGVQYSPKFPGLLSVVGGNPVGDTKPHSNSVRFDGCTFLGSIAGDTPGEYTHWRNKVQMTGQTRFYLDPNDPDLDTQADAAALKSLLNGLTPAQRDMLARSSMLMPGWSVDVGNFSNEQAADPEDTARIKLRGTIIAGILDVRGSADVHGTLLMTFRPVPGQGPLFYDGQPDMFNTTIGYFGPNDGDGEGSAPGSGEFDGFGEITLRYDPDAKLPDGIPWPITVEAIPATYLEGGSAS